MQATKSVRRWPVRAKTTRAGAPPDVKGPLDPDAGGYVLALVGWLILAFGLVILVAIAFASGCMPEFVITTL
jgi:hypothetical protein